jgi:hypothetical protein
LPTLHQPSSRRIFCGRFPTGLLTLPSRVADVRRAGSDQHNSLMVFPPATYVEAGRPFGPGEVCTTNRLLDASRLLSS